MLEQTIHNILKLRGQHKEESPGTEWFMTSPNEVANIYQVIMGISSDKVIEEDISESQSESEVPISKVGSDVVAGTNIPPSGYKQE